MQRQYYFYIMTNSTNVAVYTGMTNDLKRRVFQHREKMVEGFTKRYDIGKLVYYECCQDVRSAIEREKQIKSWSRARKNSLVVGLNPRWRDLYDEL
ncbi:MAG: GIY-YIG nuclease family protein [Chloroflexi bacterium]|nr:GIY-YIG nuclease family protein [Chloroflexota bacterium]